MPKYKVIARAKDSQCPHVQVGDAIVMKGFEPGGVSERLRVPRWAPPVIFT